MVLSQHQPHARSLANAAKPRAATPRESDGLLCTTRKQHMGHNPEEFSSESHLNKHVFICRLQGEWKREGGGVGGGGVTDVFFHCDDSPFVNELLQSGALGHQLGTLTAQSHESQDGQQVVGAAVGSEAAKEGEKKERKKEKPE